MPPRPGCKYFIGTSGWHYEHWQGLFYPEKLPKSAWLTFYTEHFRTVELNNTFYRLPTKAAVDNWYSSVPRDFVYSVKVSRFITHLKHLKNVVEPLQNFLSRADLLKDKLGPLLYQLPPQMERNETVLESFLAELPRQHQHVFEFRSSSWMQEPIFNLLRRYNAGLCVYNLPGYTSPVLATAGFAYIRFHGSAWLYSSSYSEEELRQWAASISSLSKELEAVYVYFNNDAEANAVLNAKRLEELLCQS